MSFIIIFGSIILLGSIISILIIFKWNSSLTKNYNLRCTNCKSICDSDYIKTAGNIKIAIIYGLRIKCPACSEETIFEAVKVNKDNQVMK
ncbi:hypothetical protein [Clostridium sp. BNL1100]|uniref:hypothetical protein n=1 Tax=Clostridium sp. BNL1100 TaxID=755731 RepID=UPI00024A75BC|nr:hypothetical protein [Clostridium sp. BNL1100]AEY65572.1 hypothetical protein Clo1100_1331 [Clostridium sp. BNL1100]